MATPTVPEDLDTFGLLETEQLRLERFFATLDDAGWDVPTACAGWRRREMIAHLAGSETYNLACLRDALGELMSSATAAGVSDVDSFNAWQVRLRADRPVEDVLREWRDAAAVVRRELRQLGRDGTLPTMVGQYSADAQAFHLAFEAAIHGDDVDIVVPDQERASRRAWMARFCAFALAEESRPVEVQRDDDRVRVRHAQTQEVAELDDTELVAIFSGRAPRRLSESLDGALRLYA